VNHLTTQPSGTGIICTLPNIPKIESFILDSGATDHVCFSQHSFQCLKKINPVHIKLPNGSLVTTSLAGTIVFNQNFYLNDVLYLTQFSFNLIYVHKLIDHLHCKLIFENNKCHIQETYSQKMIGIAEVKHGLYMLTEPLVSLRQVPTSICNSVAFVLDTNKHCSLWHMRFGHPSLDKLVEINKKFPFVSVNKSDSPYDTCFYAKQKRLPFPLSSHVSAHTFDLIHMDIWGPLSIPSMLGYKYFLTIVDDKSRFTWIYLMKLKLEASTLIKSFVLLIQNQFNTKIKTIRTNNGVEFLLKKNL